MHLEKWHWCNGYMRIFFNEEMEGNNIINVANINTIRNCTFEYKKTKWEEKHEGSVIVMNDGSGYIVATKPEETMRILNT